MFIYTVKSGDTLSEIAQRYKINQINIITDNNLKAPYTLLVGQCLIIDIPSLDYIVKGGDTFSSLSKEFNISIDKIKRKNNISSLSKGQRITFDYSNKNKYEIYSNGYCYQGIKEGVISKYQSFLSTISPFTYRVQEDGSLDSFQITSTIKNSKIDKVMVIANIKEKGGFSGEISHQILSNSKTKSILINNCVEIIKKENFKMLNIDFEYVKQEDKDLFTTFIIDMKAKLNEINIPLSVCLAPKTSSFQKGLLYEAHDYQKIGQVADYLILMTYEWGYTYGEPMAVSPIPQVKDVIRYAKSIVPKEKIIMGIPNYGYDWKLPYKKGTPADSISINEAYDLAIKEKVEIKHSSSYLTPYFNYVDSQGIKHVVHFDDACSYKEKLELIIKEQIGGLSIWTITNSNIQLTKLIDYYFSIKHL